MRVRTVLLALPLALVSLVTVLLLVVPAQAHTDLVSSAPADGERLAEEPTHVVLEFAAPVSADGDSVQVLDAQGVQRADAVLLSHTGRTASVVLAPGGAAGRWQVRYDVLGADGHRVLGELTFGVSAPVARSSAALPVLPALAVAAGVLVAALIALRRWVLRSPGTARE